MIKKKVQANRRFLVKPMSESQLLDVIDAYANLKFFQAEQLIDDDYLAPDGTARDDTGILMESIKYKC